uniref:E1B protein, small T-antigen n=1 Tax=Bat mastadenovirus TaxID=740971 RepID=A0A894JI46_9ADEN|nr:E1B 19K [Bat mastadenovirus]
MDILSLCNNYSTFKNIVRGSTYGPGLVRRWCFPALSDIVGTIAEENAYRFWGVMPSSHIYWDFVKRGYCTSFFQTMFHMADLSNRGRLLAFLAFVCFLLKNWPKGSVVPEADRLDLICVPAWSRLQLWQQTMTIMQQLEEDQQETGGEECGDDEMEGEEEEELEGGDSDHLLIED